MSIARFMQMAANTGEDIDPYFNQTTLLLHGDGTNGAQNNTFLDSSTNNFTITRNGNTTQGTFSPFSLPNGEWSNFFTGVSGGVGRYGAQITTTSAAFGYGTGDFTIEGWFYITGTLANSPSVISNQNGGSAALRFNSNNTVDIFIPNVGNAIVSDTFTLPLNEWFHFAAVRASNSDTFYLNGVAQGSSKTDNNNYANPTSEIIIGQTGNNGPSFPGYISNFRVVKGTAVYTGTFTPSTTPLTAISGTSLLTCQDNRFKDNSSNNFSISPGASNSVQPFSPFAPSAAYDSSVNGGSGYFDGTGDYLTTPTDADFAFGTGDYTMSCWIYSTSTTQRRIFRFSDNNDNIDINVTSAGTLNYYNGSTSTTSATTPIRTNEWNYISIVRSSGTVKGYVNGVEVLSTSSTPNTTSNRLVNVGGATNEFFSGYISNVRMVKGTAITPTSAPTSLETAVSGTELLLNFTNAGIFDNTGKNNLETVGNAQIDTTTKKYGTGSMEFDGNDYMVATAQSMTSLEGDFTVEAWVYLNSGSTEGVVVCVGDTAISSGVIFYMVANAGTMYLRVVGNNANIVWGTSQAVALQTWTHVAYVRSSGTITLYVNGNADTTTASNTSVFSGPLRIGNDFFSGATGNVYMNGFIDDLRITKGVARYTTTFTPPDKAFPDL